LALAIIEFLGFSEIEEVKVIGVDLDLMWGSVEIVSPLVQGSNAAKEFSIIDLVSSFCRVEGLRQETDGVSFSRGIHLGKNGAGCVFRGVGFDLEGTVEVGHHEDGFLRKFLLE
jgi:hypothetical protein